MSSYTTLCQSFLPGIDAKVLSHRLLREGSCAFDRYAGVNLIETLGHPVGARTIRPLHERGDSTLRRFDCVDDNRAAVLPGFAGGAQLTRSSLRTLGTLDTTASGS